MSEEEYFKYYIQGSDHYLIPKDVFDELFNELVNWREESKELKEIINKAIEYINSQSPDAGVSGKHIKEILKGVE